MPHEYTMLTIMTILFMFAWLPSSIGKYYSFGWSWIASNREPIKDKDFLPWAGRVERAYSNLKDYFPAFAIAIILLGINGRFDEGTKLASSLYVVGRVGHYVCYGLGSGNGRFAFYMVALVSNLYLLIKLF